jgi:hypothetical protein
MRLGKFSIMRFERKTISCITTLTYYQRISSPPLVLLLLSLVQFRWCVLVSLNHFVGGESIDVPMRFPPPPANYNGLPISETKNYVWRGWLAVRVGIWRVYSRYMKRWCSHWKEWRRSLDRMRVVLRRDLAISLSGGLCEG